MGDDSSSAPLAVWVETELGIKFSDVDQRWQRARPLAVSEAVKSLAVASHRDEERLVVQRVGQDIFRAGLLDYWQGRCAITGLAVPELLRASHIKPWAKCTTDAERLDVFNGLLLAPNLDAAFDAGFLTVADDGAVELSALLSSTDRVLLGLEAPLRVADLANGHRTYLAWHRAYEFRRAAPSVQ